MPSVTKKNQEITIHKDTGAETVAAEVYGNWGVHKTGKGVGFTITHIPSGKALIPGITRAKALVLLDLLDEAVPWFFTLDSESQIMRHRKEIMEAVRSAKTQTPRGGAVDAAMFFRENGLSNLGTRYGKHGDHWGIPGSAYMIRVGKRDLVLYQVNVVYRNGRNVDEWGMEDAVLLTKATPETMRKWVALVKTTTKRRATTVLGSGDTAMRQVTSSWDDNPYDRYEVGVYDYMDEEVQEYLEYDLQPSKETLVALRAILEEVTRSHKHELNRIHIVFRADRAVVSKPTGEVYFSEYHRFSTRGKISADIRGVEIRAMVEKKVLLSHMIKNFGTISTVESDRNWYEGFLGDSWNFRDSPFTRTGSRRMPERETGEYEGYVYPHKAHLDKTDFNRYMQFTPAQIKQLLNSNLWKEFFDREAYNPIRFSFHTEIYSAGSNLTEQRY